jgi:peptidoglycan/xylan/chitin deacetylase (PgdA/CDA1 family)
MNRSETLLVCDPEDVTRVGIDVKRFREQDIPVLSAPWKTITDGRLLADAVKTHDSKALIFTQNDEGPKRPDIGGLLRTLRIGYSCASGIDANSYDDQTRLCLETLLRGRGIVDVPPAQTGVAGKAGAEGTFSLIFDLEQVGGAAFGMPRILPFIEARGIRAVFFVTGIIRALYPELMRRICAGGHELGVHGAHHEFLQGKSLLEQTETVKNEARLLGEYGPVQGANFIFRMDHASPAAFSLAGLKYFVLFRKHLFHKTRFMPQSSRPRSVCSHGREIPFFPIGAETYEYPLREIKGMLESSFSTARLEGVRHVSCLMHPFKDGALRYWDRTRWTVDFLIEKLRLRPVPLAALIPEPSGSRDALDRPVCRLVYRWDGFEPGELLRRAPTSCGGGPEDGSMTASALIPGSSVHSMNRPWGVFTRDWWSPVLYHAPRVEALQDALRRSKILAPQLVAYGADSRIEGGANKEPPCAVVCPDGIEGAPVIVADPFKDSSKLVGALAEYVRRGLSVTVVPPTGIRGLVNYACRHLPRTFNDLFVLAVRVAARLGRLLRGKGRRP